MHARSAGSVALSLAGVRASPRYAPAPQHGADVNATDMNGPRSGKPTQFALGNSLLHCCVLHGQRAMFQVRAPARRAQHVAEEPPWSTHGVGTGLVCRAVWTSSCTVALQCQRRAGLVPHEDSRRP